MQHRSAVVTPKAILVLGSRNPAFAWDVMHIPMGICERPKGTCKPIRKGDRVRRSSRAAMILGQSLVETQKCPWWLVMLLACTSVGGQVGRACVLVYGGGDGKSDRRESQQGILGPLARCRSCPGMPGTPLVLVTACKPPNLKFLSFRALMFAHRIPSVQGRFTTLAWSQLPGSDQPTNHVVPPRSDDEPQSYEGRYQLRRKLCLSRFLTSPSSRTKYDRRQLPAPAIAARCMIRSRVTGFQAQALTHHTRRAAEIRQP